jgi:hypothetical protein
MKPTPQVFARHGGQAEQDDLFSKCVQRVFHDTLSWLTAATFTK